MTEENGTPPQEHYFTPNLRKAVTRNRRIVTVRLDGRDLEVETASGVFSNSRLDLGTQVLLRKVPELPADVTNVLDLGCGWGPIALSMAMQAPQATVWAVDVNDLALELTKKNADRHGLKNIKTAMPDDVPGGVRFDAIWSNPPIRVGRAILDSMLLHWLPRLAPGARAYLVVQRNLGSDSLQRWMGTRLAGEMPGLQVNRLGSAKGYRVLEVVAGSTDS